MIAKMADPEIGQAMEEFLFGISYEEILYVRNQLVSCKIPAMGREDVAKLLNKKLDFDNSDPRHFYSSYVQRRNNADARKRLNAAGPKNTLEDYYISFLFEKGLELKDGKAETKK